MQKDDVIYRQAAIDAVRHSPIIKVQPAYMLIDKGDVLKNLIIVPSAPQKIAYLISPHPYGKCSNCGQLIDIRDGYNYCPNCGYKLRGGNNET